MLGYLLGLPCLWDRALNEADFPLPVECPRVRPPWFSETEIQFSICIYLYTHM